VKKKKKFRKRKTTFSTGRNAGHRHRGAPMMESRLIDWVIDPTDSGIYPSPDTVFEVSTETNEMWDTHGYIQNWYNPCIQEKFKSSDGPVPPLVDADSTYVDFGTTFPSFRPLTRATYPFLTDFQLDELALQAEQKLSRMVGLNVDLLNFLRELIEMITGNIRIVKRFANLYERMIDAFRKAYQRFLKQGHKETAAYWLAWNFAIKPFLSDLRGLLCSFSQAHKKLEWMKNHNHKVVYLTYTRDCSDMLSFDPDAWLTGDRLVSTTRCEPPGVPPNGAYHMQIKWFECQLKFTARSKIFLDIPDHLLNGATGMGALWAAYQGLTNPIGVIWEGIPFSWLIDYFLSYRARLWQTIYDGNPFDEGVTVLDYGHSFKFEGIALGRVHNTTYDVTHHSKGRIDYTLYVRRRGLPFPEESDLSRVPSNWYQGSIIGSIVVGRLPRRR
jgi:hypothetical protein